MKSGHALAMTLATLIASLTFAGWPPNPNQNLPIADRPDGQVLPKVASTPDGGWYIAWFDLASGNYDVYLQRLDQLGNEVWPHNGLLVSGHPQGSWLTDWDMIADSAGNAVLVFPDIRVGGDRDIYAYRIDSAGDFLWGPDGVALSNNDDFEGTPRAAEASDGSFIFTWMRETLAGDAVVTVQKLSAAGTPQFGPEGLQIRDAPGEVPGFPNVIPADGGSFIVVWLRDIAIPMGVRHIHARKFSSAGTALWPAPVVVCSRYVPPVFVPFALRDGAGGVVVAWHDAPGSWLSSHVQHLDASGNELFPHNGVQLSTRTTHHHIGPTIAYNELTGEIIAFWNERSSGQGQRGIYAQKVSATGQRMWTDHGLELLPVDDNEESDPGCVPFADGAVVFCVDQPTPGHERVLAIRVDTHGNAVWGKSPAILSSYPSGKGRCPVAVGPTGVAVAAWQDSRHDTGDIYAQNVNPNASLGNLGDLNCDGKVNFDDIDPFVLALSGQAAYSAVYLDCNWLLADINCDGTVNFDDIDPFVALLGG